MLKASLCRGVAAILCFAGLVAVSAPGKWRVAAAHLGFAASACLLVLGRRLTPAQAAELMHCFAQMPDAWADIIHPFGWVGLFFFMISELDRGRWNARAALLYVACWIGNPKTLNDVNFVLVYMHSAALADKRPVPIRMAQAEQPGGD